MARPAASAISATLVLLGRLHRLRLLRLLAVALPVVAGCSAAAEHMVPALDGGPGSAPLGICINELMPDNVAALADETGAMPDWIELHNPGATPVDLSGWSLTDDPAAPSRSVLPAGVMIAAGGFLLLWADHLPALGPRHLGFKLDNAGGGVGLFAPDHRGSVVDYVKVERDFSAARRPDCCIGAGCFSFVFRGSPGRSNVDAPPPEVKTVVAMAPGSTWRYLDSGAAPAASWNTAAFNDSAWRSGPAPLGYGDAHIVTSVGFGPDPANKYITTWLRAKFTLADHGSVKAARVSLLRDDGALVYLNGKEVARSNLPAGALTPATVAPLGITGTDETTFFDFEFDPRLLVEGENQLAVELHQAVANSSDLGMDCSVSIDRPVK